MYGEEAGTTPIAESSCFRTAGSDFEEVLEPGLSSKAPDVATGTFPTGDLKGCLDKIDR